MQAQRAVILPLDIVDRKRELTEAKFEDGEWMVVDELGRFPIDDRVPVRQLQVDRPEVRVVVILMPAQQELSLRLDPADPAVVVLRTGLYVESNFKSPCLYWIGRGLQPLLGVRLRDDPVWTRLSMCGDSQLDSATAGRFLEAGSYPPVEALVSQVGPVSEKDHLDGRYAGASRSSPSASSVTSS